jgi:hypothetical protein
VRLEIRAEARPAWGNSSDRTCQEHDAKPAFEPGPDIELEFGAIAN